MQPPLIEIFNSSYIEIPSLQLNLISEVIKSIYLNANCSFSWINVIFLTNDEHTAMNNKFLQHNYPTDILTFPFEEGEEINGELYINPFVALENAREFEEPLRREIQRLIIHGALHLVGFNDSTKAEKEEMNRLENFYLEKLTE